MNCKWQEYIKQKHTGLDLHISGYCILKFYGTVFLKQNNIKKGYVASSDKEFNSSEYAGHKYNIPLIT